MPIYRRLWFCYAAIPYTVPQNRQFAYNWISETCNDYRKTVDSELRIELF